MIYFICTKPKILGSNIDRNHIKQFNIKYSYGIKGSTNGAKVHVIIQNAKKSFIVSLPCMYMFNSISNKDSSESQHVHVPLKTTTT